MALTTDKTLAQLKDELCVLEHEKQYWISLKEEFGELRNSQDMRGLTGHFCESGKLIKRQGTLKTKYDTWKTIQFDQDIISQKKKLDTAIQAKEAEINQKTLELQI